MAKKKSGLKQKGKEAASETAGAFLEALKFIGSSTKKGFEYLNKDDESGRKRR